MTFHIYSPLCVLRQNAIKPEYAPKYVCVCVCWQFLNYQRNNKTIIYRMLDVANQVDWVRPWVAPPTFRSNTLSPESGRSLASIFVSS